MVVIVRRAVHALAHHLFVYYILFILLLFLFVCDTIFFSLLFYGMLFAHYNDVVNHNNVCFDLIPQVCNDSLASPTSPTTGRYGAYCWLNFLALFCWCPLALLVRRLDGCPTMRQIWCKLPSHSDWWSPHSQR